MDGIVGERIVVVGGAAASREQGSPPGLDEALHVPADPVRPLREHVAVIGEQASTIAARRSAACWIGTRRVAVQLAGVVLIRVRSSRQGFVGFLEIRKAPR